MKPIAVIIGGASGIGNACAQLLSEEYTVGIADIRGAEEAAAKLGNGAFGITLDITDAEACEAAAQKVREFGEVDVLVHCAGIFTARNDLLGDMKVADWDILMRVNLHGTFYAVRAFIPTLRDSARVVLISSRAGRCGSTRMDIHMPTSGHYCASKAAVNSLVKSFALELAPRGIRVNGVAPGPIQTPLTTPNSDSFILPYVPLGRRGTPAEIAKSVRFLCSEDSSFITGHMLEVNGGMSMV